MQFRANLPVATTDIILQDISGISIRSRLHARSELLLLECLIQSLRLLLALGLFLVGFNELLMFLSQFVQLFGRVCVRSALPSTDQRKRCSTSKLEFQILHLIVGALDCVVQMRTEIMIALRQALRKVVLISTAFSTSSARYVWSDESDSHFLCHLIIPERQTSSSNLHDDGWTQAREDAGLVVFAWVQRSKNSVVWVVESCLAGGTSALSISGCCQPETICTGKTEYVTVGQCQPG
jgi:hypothetical protein